MRIDSIAQVANMYNLGKNSKQIKSDSKKSFSDQLQISSIGRDIQLAKAALADTPDIREDLVRDIKSRIDAGTYSIDSDSLAQKLYAKYQSS